MGAQPDPKELPEPMRSLLSIAKKPSPLIFALVWGAISGVFGGVLVMALVGLVVTIFNVPAESYVGITATAVAFVLSSAVIGFCVTVFVWRWSEKNGRNAITV